jgi:hypothetical protein
MQRPTPKFEIGDRVRDTYNGKTGVITTLYWSEGDEYNEPEWAYSIDAIGWLFIGESDLSLIVGEV